MKKCRKCSNKLLPEVTICEKCAMPVFFEPESNHFPRPSYFLRQIKEARLKAINDTKPIPLFDDDDNLKSLSTAEIYAESGMDVFEESLEEKAKQNKKTKKTAYKTISIPLFDERKPTGRIAQIDELEDESEELIISDLEDDDAEELGYEPEIIAVGDQHLQEDNASDSSIDMDMEYMPLPGDNDEDDEEEIPLKKPSQDKRPIVEENKQTQKISRSISQKNLKVEYIDEYPDTWEWVLFNNDTENRFGYQISGRERERGHFDFLIFPDQDTSDSVMSKISDQQKTQIKTLLKQGQVMESVRHLRKNFKALSIRQAQKIVKKFARQERFKVQSFEMVIDSLPTKSRKVILRILRQGKTLEAIYLFRSMTKMSLKESREQIEYLCEKESLTYNPLQVTTEHLMIKKKSVDGLVILIRLILISLISLGVWAFFF